MTEAAVLKEDEVDADTLAVEKGETLTKISWSCSEVYEYVWLSLDTEYDMKKTETGYEVTVLSSVYEQYQENMKIIGMQNEGLTVYCVI